MNKVANKASKPSKKVNKDLKTKIKKNVVKEDPKKSDNEMKETVKEIDETKIDETADETKMDIEIDLSKKDQKEKVPLPENKVFIDNKRVIIVKNINKSSKIEDVLALIKNEDNIIKHQSVIVRNRSVKTQMLTINFKTSEQTNKLIKKLNSSVIDGNALTAEYKKNPVDTKIEAQSCKIIIKNMPKIEKETIRDLIKDFNVSSKNIQLLRKYGKNTCFITFNSKKDATKACQLLKSEPIEGVILDIKFENEKVETKTDDDTLLKTTLHITNLPYTAKKEDVSKEFDMADSIHIPVNSHGKSKGCCYLTFKSEEMCALAFEAFQDKMIYGRKIKCKYSEKGTEVVPEDKEAPAKESKRLRKPKEGTSIMLFNLPKGVTNNEITEKFSEVKTVRVRVDGQHFKGIAEVQFKTAAAAKAALAQEDFSLGGKVIRKTMKDPNFRKNEAASKAATVEAAGETEAMEIQICQPSLKLRA